MVSPAGRPEFGDYQANGVMGAAKLAKTNPRKLAEQVKPAADAALAEISEPLEIAGPGFLNIRLKRSWLEGQLAAMAAGPSLGIDPVTPQRVVVDYSGPNLAKEMHVGHLRSTIIGDALARMLEFLGHTVIRQNHVGDWGTQFGMLMAHFRTALAENPAAGQELGDLEEFYRQAKQRFDADPAFAEQARQEVVKLQAGDEESLSFWRRFCEVSLAHCRQVYRELGVSLTDADLRGESFYNFDLPSVVADLAKAGLLSESQGAQVVFMDEFKGRDGEPLPVIVQKSGGGFLYATTDLAALRFRSGTLKADRVLVVTDSRQSLHLAQVFTLARKAGFVREGISLEYLPFGTVMGSDGKPFKTRTGGTVKLADLLEEAKKRSLAVVAQKNAELAAGPRAGELSRIVGIGAVKYADLSQNRASDYVFSFEKMLAMDGNTAPYMQYAYARIRSIFRKRDEAGEFVAGPIALSEPAERALGLKLLQFAEMLQLVAQECLPNLLCGYLYDLAGAFTTFYENCPVLKADAATRASRLSLCDLTARVIQTGLALLGIETVEEM